VSPRRTATASLATTILCAVLLAPAPASADTAPRVKPAAGAYELRPAKITSSFALGAFSVVNDGGRRRIVSSERYAGIFYPDLGECDSVNVPLTAESVAISRKGRFSIRDRYPVKGKAIVVKLKGAWVKPKKVLGTVRIRYKGCRSKFKWVGRRLLPIG
jgi:hypothetical protein